MSDAETQQMTASGSWIQTYTGKRFDPFNPDPDEIDIKDIAHALALSCRFNGHCLNYYSVAEHSMRVANILPPALKIYGLLHDGSEAYLCDVPRPIKRQLKTYQNIERDVSIAIFEKFSLDRIDENAKHLYPDMVVEADDILLVTEKRDLILETGADWGLKAIPLEDFIIPNPNIMQVEDDFIYMFEKLMGLDITVPERYWHCHSKDCNTLYRGCSPDCPKDYYEETGIWLGSGHNYG